MLKNCHSVIEPEVGKSIHVFSVHEIEGRNYLTVHFYHEHEGHEDWVYLDIPEHEYVSLCESLVNGYQPIVIRCRKGHSLMFSRSLNVLVVSDCVDTIGMTMSSDLFLKLHQAMRRELGDELFSGGWPIYAPRE